jgi:hypothetical protein
MEKRTDDMDMRVYFRKIREMEEQLREDPVVVISLETPDGGKPGVPTEVSRRNAARLLVEGRAQLASADESAYFRETQREAKVAADEMEAARRVQFTVVPSSELRNMKGGTRAPRA